MTSWMKISGLCLILGFSAIGLRAQESDLPAEVSKPVTVQNLGFNYEQGKSKLEIDFDGDVTFEKNISEADKQVIIDIKNAKIGKKWARRIDTSQHKSNISMVSPYQSGDLVRVVLQLKDNGGVEVSQDGKKIIALIDNKIDLPAANSDAKADIAQTLTDPAKADPVAPSAAAETPALPAAPAVATTVADQSADGTSDSLDTYLKARANKTYVGKKIYLQFRDTELPDVFRAISEASEFNILVSDSVKGKIMLNLVDVPWDQALDIILQSQHLTAERRGNILRVTTLDAYTKEKEAESNALRATEAAEPLVVKIFPISYAKVDDLKKVITDFMTKENGNAGPAVPNLPQAANAAAAPGGLRGSIQTDSRTNSLIVRDTPSTMEKIKRIIKELDTQTPQILIEAKFVEVKQGSSRQMDGRIFATSRQLDSTGANLSFPISNNNFAGLFNSSTPASPALTAVNGSGGGGFGFTPKIGLFPGLSEIGALLNIIESDNNGKVIASPRIVTQNKEAATITQGQSITLSTVGGTNTPGQFQTITATLSLNVTPQVTNDGSISMKVNFSQDTFDAPPAAGAAPPPTSNKAVNTQVLVDSGGTIVIGGVYRNEVSEAGSGIPFLRNLPIVGVFFGSKAKVESKYELFIFLTPRVINEKESGIKG